MLRFENVSFAYPQSSKPALRDVSFGISPGESVAIVAVASEQASAFEAWIATQTAAIQAEYTTTDPGATAGAAAWACSSRVGCWAVRVLPAASTGAT